MCQQAPTPVFAQGDLVGNGVGPRQAQLAQFGALMLLQYAFRHHCFSLRDFVCCCLLSRMTCYMTKGTIQVHAVSQVLLATRIMLC
jgi:hypothetical protein